MTSFLELAGRRQSIRKYLDRPVEREKIQRCIEAALLAPSASNTQPWRYIIVDEQALKEKLCQAAFSSIFFINKFANKAPVIVVAIAEPDNISNRLGKLVQGLFYYLLDIGASIEHFLLQACEEGLGTCWLGWYSENRIKDLLNIPRGKKIVSVISLGYPAETDIRPKSRKPADEISSFNCYKP